MIADSRRECEVSFGKTDYPSLSKKERCNGEASGLPLDVASKRRKTVKEKYERVVFMEGSPEEFS